MVIKYGGAPGTRFLQNMLSSLRLLFYLYAVMENKVMRLNSIILTPTLILRKYALCFNILYTQSQFLNNSLGNTVSRGSDKEK